MRGGVLIVAFGLLTLYMGISGKYRPFVRAFREAFGLPPDPKDTASNSGAGAASSGAITYADLIRPLEVPGFTQEPYLSPDALQRLESVMGRSEGGGVDYSRPSAEILRQLQLIDGRSE